MPQNKTDNRGGARPNAGRKKGSSVFGENTTAIRIPDSLIPTIKTLLDDRKQQLGQLANSLTTIFYPAKTPIMCKLPLYVGKVSAGFPSPADDYIEKTLDLNQLLIQKPAATFFARAQGYSMIGAGIHHNDILIVDRSIEAVPGKIVVCALNGELTVKRLDRFNGQWQLKAENPDYPDITIFEDLEMVLWGVVTNVIHPL
ncbi:MAG: translesion error-prone DNA polymerase V autoproteolytic subunit [Methylotenera sp.]|nr:translesion error-prone DNA polymerase V autoproteolytic subunit [Methylotenera sp.]